MPRELPPPLTSEQVLAFHKSLSNWGRFGEDDQLGTLNLITPEKRAAAARLVTTGRTVSGDVMARSYDDGPRNFLEFVRANSRLAPEQRASIIALDNSGTTPVAIDATRITVRTAAEVRQTVRAAASHLETGALPEGVIANATRDYGNVDLMVSQVRRVVLSSVEGVQ